MYVTCAVNRGESIALLPPSVRLAHINQRTAFSDICSRLAWNDPLIVFASAILPARVQRRPDEKLVYPRPATWLVGSLRRLCDDAIRQRGEVNDAM